MNLEHVAAFVAVVDHGSFHAAADARRISQPALTKQIQAFERWVGTPVLDRSRTGATPTSAGRAILERCRRALGDAAAFDAHVRDVGAGRAGTLSVGFGMSTLRSVPSAVRAYAERHPDVTVTLEDLSSTEQVRRLRDGRLDVGFGRRPTDDDVTFVPLWSDRLALITVTPDVADVRAFVTDRPLARLVREKGPGLAAQLDELAAAWGIVLRTLTETHDLLTVIALATAGVAPAIVPLSAGPLVPANLHITPIDDLAARWSVGALHRPDAGVPAHTLIALAREV